MNPSTTAVPFTERDPQPCGSCRKRTAHVGALCAVCASRIGGTR